MKKSMWMIGLLLAGLPFAHADKYAPVGNTLADALQWLAVQTACLGEYSMAQTGDSSVSDPMDNYRPPDVREYLARQSGNRTRSLTFYGICFDYAQTAYNIILQNSSQYGNLGVKAWYMAGTHKNSREIILIDPTSKEKSDYNQNGVPVKVASRQNVRAHGDATSHAWLWVYGNDGNTYWIDPTWTDNTGYIWWGVVRNGREEQVAPLPRLCAVKIPASTAFVSLTSGDANRNTGKHDEAIKDYDEAIRVEPNYAVIYNNRGRSYYAKGEYDKAIADFNQSITLDPNYVDAYNNRGLAYYAKGDLDKAMADYTQAITLDPEFALAYNGRAYVYLARKDYNRAIAEANQALKAKPREATWYVTIGEIWLSAGKKKEAAQMFTMALKMSPNFTRAKELLERTR